MENENSKDLNKGNLIEENLTFKFQN